MKIYTKTGDRGETSLHGGKRIGKDALRIEAYGTVDELNAHIGMVLASDQAETVRQYLQDIQSDLFILGADLATPLEAGKEVPRITPGHAQRLEKLIDAVEERLEPLSSFVLPGGSETAARVHVARTVCRRAERRVVALARVENIGHDAVIFLNRLADLLFVVARFANRQAGRRETPWSPSA